MKLCCCDFELFVNDIIVNEKRLVMFGAGAIGNVVVPELLRENKLLDSIDCYVDNDCSKWGSSVELYSKIIEIKSPDYLNMCSEETVILLNISRFSDAIKQLEELECTKNMDCYIMPMMLIHNYCINPSCGSAKYSESSMIPKKIHYMWLGKKALPDNIKRCIDSWEKYCPDYEIIRWNEDNYDICKNEYMKQAYEQGAYGFVPDYARLDILYNEGGIYLDTDVEIKRNIDALLYQEAFCSVEKWQLINFGGMSGAVKGHHMIRRFLDARKNIKFLYENGKQNRNTCGFYDTKVALEAGYVISGTTQNINGMNIYAYDYFHPYDYMSGTLKETSNTYSVHWFNGGWLDDNMRLQNEMTAMKYRELYERSLKM